MTHPIAGGPLAAEGRTVLLLGISETIPAGHGPFLDHLAALGWRAVVCALKVDPRLRVKAWRVLEVDPSSPSAVLEAVEGLRFEAVLPLGDGMVAAAAALAAAWRQPHPSPAACALVRSKATLKQQLLLEGIATPPFETAPYAALRGGVATPSLAPPWIVKPVRSEGGSRGVFAAACGEELVRGLELHEADYGAGEVLLEPLLQGTEHSLEVIVHQGRAEILSISDKVNYAGHASVVQSLQFPGPIGWGHREAIGAAVERLPRALGLTHAVLHIEFLVTGRGPFLIDLSLRPGGSYNLHPIVLLSTGHDYAALLLALAAGLDELPPRRLPAGALAWHFFDPARLTSTSTAVLPTLQAEPDVLVAELLVPPRALLQDGDRPGSVMVLGRDPEAALGRARELAERLYR